MLLFYYIISFILHWAALSTYWDFITGKDNLYLHGFFVGLSTIPYMFLGIPLYLIIIRSIVLAISFGLINKYANKWTIPHSDDLEELSRGGLLIITLPILLI